MKVLLVNGGPHKNGCTARALQEMEQVLTENGIECETVWVGVDAIAGCIGCGACRRTGACFRKDCVNEFVEKAKTADGFVFGSPVHYAGASGALTSFMDRAFYSGGAHLRYKPACAIVSARRSGTTATVDQLNKYFTINRMPVVSSQYWNAVHGNTPADVEQDREGLQTMRTLARNMAWLLKCIDLGKANGVTPPTEEEPERTNFIH